MSVAARSFISLFANLFKGVAVFFTGILLARGLGPEEYGVFAFLLASFIALRSLLEMGTSSAFQTFISKRNRSRQFFFYYIIWMIFQFVISLLFIGILAPEDWLGEIWGGESRERVLVAFVAVFLQQQVWNMIAQVGESQRLTVRVQAINVSIVVIHLAIVSGMYWFDVLSIERVYGFIIAEFMVVVVVAYFLFPLIYSEEIDTPHNVIKEYWGFCLPLIPHTFAVMIVGYTDTRMLQHYGGAVEQAYFAVAAQFSVISLIATVSVMRILWKEVAEANERGDEKRVQALFERASRILFVISAIIACFLIPWAKDIISLLLGDAYIGGAFVMALMLFYPIYQSLGQLSGTMYYSLEMTRPYVAITIVNMIISIIILYFFLAPVDARLPGLGLASTGLALKMVVVQIFGVNFLMWWLARRKKWNYSIGYQIIGIVIFVSLGFALYHAINMTIGFSVHVVLRAFIAGTIYISLVGLLLWRIPWLMGMNQQELIRLVRDLKRTLSSDGQKVQ